MKKTSLACAFALLVTAVSVPALADTTGRLSFRELEYQQPRDPLLSPNAAIGDDHYTDQQDLAPAADALRAALNGMPRAQAEALLHKAGAHCRPADGSSETCRYFDVETRDEYVDDVHWNVKLSLANDQVDGVAVDRTWTRH